MNYFLNIQRWVEIALQRVGVKYVDVRFDDTGDPSLDIDGIGVIFDENGLTLYRTIHVPGCRTLANGDPGWPDDVDISDIETYPPEQWQNCAHHMVKVIVNDWMENVLEGLALEELYRDEVAA